MKKWEILHKKKKADTSQTIESIIAIVLENRGLKTKKAIDAFLHPKFEDIAIEHVSIDQAQVEKTIQRIRQAIENKEQIVIYGDYDVDGITASAILWETLHNLGALVTPYIPHRLEEGYGLSIPGIEHILDTTLKENKRFDLSKTKLIITVDNGIVAHAAVSYAQQRGIDVIVTDHHTAGAVLPSAYAIVHTTNICGAGVAYVLAQAIKMAFGVSVTKEDDDLLELAALGTIADLVPLTNISRAIVLYGLEKLCKTKRPGLLALFEEAGCKNGTIGVYEVGHVIAPRLNATGRMSSAMDSLRLLCTKDRKRAEELASLLGTVNKERQQVMQDAANHAKLSVQAREEVKKLLVVSHDSYPEGVIGLVAGRLVEEFYRPSIVIAKGEKISKGSVRSVSGFNIIEFLRQFSDYFINLGGHPMAAGFTIETENIAKLEEKIDELIQSVLHDDRLIRTLHIDCEIPLTLVTNTFYAALQALAPFGMANYEPVFVTRGVRIDDIRVLGREGKHLRVTISAENAVMEAIAFGFGEKAAELHIGDSIDIAYIVDMNEWQGRSKLQLKVKDIQLNI